jgi:hypothetical protein
VNKPILLFLRSFGDFTIAIAVLKRADAPLPFRLVVSHHLKPLYEAIMEKLPGLRHPVEFIDFDIRNKILGYFTNRHALAPHSFKELRNLKRFIQQQGKNQEIFFERREKLWLIAPMVGFNRPTLHSQGNVYASYCDQLHVSYRELSFEPCTQTARKVLIMPESRKKQKELPPSLVCRLATDLIYEGHEVTTAFFRASPYVVPGNTATHHSFTDLINLILDADELITADSLPAHLAQLEQKPHKVYYRGKPDPDWFTPYVAKYKSYACF